MFACRGNERSNSYDVALVKAVILALVGAGIAAALGAAVGWIERPKWAKNHRGWVVALVVVLAGLGALVGLGASNFITFQSLPSVDQRAEGSGCPPNETLGSQNAAVERTAPPDFPLSLAEKASFKLIYADKMQLELGGALIGNTPPGKRLVLLSWADPGSVDVNGDRGNGIYYRMSSLRTTANCWLRPQGNIAYSGAEGLTFRHWLVVIDESRYADFSAPQYESGYNDVTLDSFGVIRLGYFDVKTAR